MTLRTFKPSTLNIACAAAALAGGLFAATSQAQEATLRFNRWVPPTHHFHARIMVGWAERVEKATQGRVKVEFTPASLGAPARQFELAQTGIADVTAGNQTYTAERFVASRVAEMPFLGDNSEAISVAHWRTQVRHLAKADEYKGTRLITVFNNGPYQIFTTKKPITSVADLRNMKMRAPAGMPTDIGNALGVVSVSGPITEAYEMLSRGIVDGTFLPSDSIRSFQMEKVLAHQTQVPLGLLNSAFFVVMNEAKWNALSKANQEAIMSVSGEAFAREAGRIWDDQDRLADEQFAKSGMKIAKASDAFTKELHEKLSGIEAQWIKDVASRGVDGKAAIEMLRKESAGYKPR